MHKVVPVSTSVPVTQPAHLVDADPDSVNRPVVGRELEPDDAGVGRVSGQLLHLLEAARGSLARASARNARPRWLIASFSAGLISAVVRVSPSGTKIGS